MEKTDDSDKQTEAAQMLSPNLNNVTNANTEAESSEDPPLSKKQLKKRKRWEKALATKKRRKEQMKEIRFIKAQNEGRDLDAEREQQAKNAMDGKGWERREQLWRDRCNNSKIDESFRVCFDCSFEEQMTWKEVNSLSLQLRYTYAVNRKSPMPVYIDVCGLKRGCDTRKHMEKVEGFPNRWADRAFCCHEESLEDIFGTALSISHVDTKDKEDDDANRDCGEHSYLCKDNSQQPRPKLRPNHKLVYLTGDSENTLSTLDNNTTYVIGGIVGK
jgi:tRNA (guanine9-N1)-methyltransferase